MARCEEEGQSYDEEQVWWPGGGIRIFHIFLASPPSRNGPAEPVHVRLPLSLPSSRSVPPFPPSSIVFAPTF